MICERDEDWGARPNGRERIHNFLTLEAGFSTFLFASSDRREDCCQSLL